VDGVYDSDPVKNPGARRYERLSYRQVALDGLKVMDETAITLCKENNIPVIVFSIMEPGNILRAALGQPVGVPASRCRAVLGSSSLLPSACCGGRAGQGLAVSRRPSGLCLPAPARAALSKRGRAAGGHGGQHL
jgi:hypothetical protein